MRFYLGTHKPQWLGFEQFAEVPLFISHRALSTRKVLRRAIGPYAVDSGGFTELQKYGAWMTSPTAYVDALRRYRTQAGPFDWAAPQDWMCESFVIHGGTHNGIHFAGTGLSVAEHQRRTVANFLDLRRLAPDLPIIPVLQGMDLSDYLRCADMYCAAGVDLELEPTVGIGSVCRREATDDICAIVETLKGCGLNLHGFGVKTSGLAQYGQSLHSADSLAWSFAARRDAHHRREQGKPSSRFGCAHGTNRNGACNNCPTYALAWRLRAHFGMSIP